MVVGRAKQGLNLLFSAICLSNTASMIQRRHQMTELSLAIVGHRDSHNEKAMILLDRLPMKFPERLIYLMESVFIKHISVSIIRLTYCI